MAKHVEKLCRSPNRLFPLSSGWEGKSHADRWTSRQAMPEIQTASGWGNLEDREEFKKSPRPRRLPKAICYEAPRTREKLHLRLSVTKLSPQVLYVLSSPTQRIPY
ncbi:hypothetical protein KM043_003617 [Ampulex compressa]|nr:hypothetical protein KM043_003617 [Ampulex compressa]